MSIRVYLPMTSSSMAALVVDGRVDGPLRAHAVTPELQAAWPEADVESWEYAALMAAAGASADLRGTADRPRRMVVVADLAHGTGCEPVPGEDPTAVVVTADLRWEDVVAAHVDTVDEAAEDDDLAWYATQEIPHLT